MVGFNWIGAFHIWMERSYHPLVLGMATTVTRAYIDCLLVPPTELWWDEKAELWAHFLGHDDDTQKQMNLKIQHAMINLLDKERMTKLLVRVGSQMATKGPTHSELGYLERLFGNKDTVELQTGVLCGNPPLPIRRCQKSKERGVECVIIWSTDLVHFCPKIKTTGLTFSDAR